MNARPSWMLNCDWHAYKTNNIDCLLNHWIIVWVKDFVVFDSLSYFCVFKYHFCGFSEIYVCEKQFITIIYISWFIWNFTYIIQIVISIYRMLIIFLYVLYNILIIIWKYFIESVQILSWVTVCIDVFRSKHFSVLS